VAPDLSVKGLPFFKWVDGVGPMVGADCRASEK